MRKEQRQGCSHATLLKRNSSIYFRKGMGMGKFVQNLPKLKKLKCYEQVFKIVPSIRLSSVLSSNMHKERFESNRTKIDKNQKMPKSNKM